MVSVHNYPTYDTAEKFHLLFNKCVGQAHTIIAPYKFVTANYLKALKHLIRRYRRPHLNQLQVAEGFSQWRFNSSTVTLKRASVHTLE